MSDYDFVDGVSPRAALTAPSAISLYVSHTTISLDHFANQMATFDRMRETNAEFRRLANGGRS